MKHAIYLFSIIMLLSFETFSQSNTCNCLENLDKLVSKTEENYAGFPAKVHGNLNKNYEQLIKILRQKTLNETNAKRCFYLLKEYIRFFKDKHFILSYSNEADYDNERIAYSSTNFKNAASKRPMSAVEGIWINADTSLKLAIQKFPQNVYKAIVVESKDPKIPAGLVYLTLTPFKNRFVAKEFNSFITTDIPAKQKGNLLQVWNHNLFGKVYPEEMTTSERVELNTWRNNNNGLNFQVLSAKTAYLKIPTFFNNDAKIQKLISENDAAIKTHENLIIDLTGNSGGNTGWVSFLPYLMTNAVEQYDTYVRVTPDNVKSKLADIEPYVINPIPIEYKKYFPDKIVAAYKKAYQELPKTKNLFYPVPGVTFPLDSIVAKPAKVALIVDDFCGSSTEYFFSISKQSKKTTTYGINTIGMMDYEGMSTPTALPYNKYILTIPIVKSSWTDTKAIDQTGMKPDKLLNTVQQKDWVDYVRKDMEQN